MKVFLSWAGRESGAVAEALRAWLPDVINAAIPFMSESDIEKGSVGLVDIATNLREAEFGIVCLTRENMNRPWINYEAGALAKSLDDDQARVATLLIDIDKPTDVSGPLAAFQATRLYDLKDFKKLICSIAIAADDPRTPEKLGNVVDLLWPDLEKLASKEALAPFRSPADEAPRRTPEDKLDELLGLVRQLAKPAPRASSIVDLEALSLKAGQRIRDPQIRDMLHRAQRAAHMAAVEYGAQPNDVIIGVTAPGTLRVSVKHGFSHALSNAIREAVGQIAPGLDVTIIEVDPPIPGAVVE